LGESQLHLRRPCPGQRCGPPDAVPSSRSRRRQSWYFHLAESRASNARLPCSAKSHTRSSSSFRSRADALRARSAGDACRVEGRQCTAVPGRSVGDVARRTSLRSARNEARDERDLVVTSNCRGSNSTPIGSNHWPSREPVRLSARSPIRRSSPVSTAPGRVPSPRGRPDTQGWAGSRPGAHGRCSPQQKLRRTRRHSVLNALTSAIATLGRTESRDSVRSGLGRDRRSSLPRADCLAPRSWRDEIMLQQVQNAWPRRRARQRDSAVGAQNWGLFRLPALKS